MATTICEIDGVRPAVATVRIRQNGEERTIAVCEEHLRELQGQSRGAGRSPFGGRSSLFDEFFSDFFGDSPLGGRTAGDGAGMTTTRPRRPAEQIDVTQYFSDATRQLLQSAPLHRLLRGLLEQLAGGVAEVLRDVDLLGRAARPRGRHAVAAAGRATAERSVAEEVGEELVEEAAPATEGRPRRSAALLSLIHI